MKVNGKQWLSMVLMGTMLLSGCSKDGDGLPAFLSGERDPNFELLSTTTYSTDHKALVDLTFSGRTIKKGEYLVCSNTETKVYIDAKWKGRLEQLHIELRQGTDAQVLYGSPVPKNPTSGAELLSFSLSGDGTNTTVGDVMKITGISGAYVFRLQGMYDGKKLSNILKTPEIVIATCL